MKNEYEIRGEITAIFLKKKDGSSVETLIDTSDLDKVKSFPFSFYLTWGKEVRSYYAHGDHYVNRGKKISTSVHRIVMGMPENMYVDHINNDTLDNRKSNLRVVTNAENAQNRKGANINSTTGIRGVSWHKASNKWRAFIRVNYKQIQLGVFDDIEDAKRCVEDARGKYMRHSKEALAN